MAVNRLSELAAAISDNTKIVTDYLTSKGLSAPSFDIDGLDEFPIPSSDKEVFTARLNIIAATKELHDLAVGPKEGPMYLAWDGADSLSLHGVSHYKIAEAVPIHGEISYVDLSKKVNVDLTNLRQIVRHAMTNHIFREPRKGFVTHTRTSRLLAEDIKMQAWTAMYVEDLYLPNAYTIEAMDKWPGSQEPTEAGCSLALNTKDPFFVEMAKDPVRLKRYQIGMSSITGGEGFEAAHFVDNYPWDSLGDGTVVDMGGAGGYVSFAIATKFPKLKSIIQDLPSMVTPEVIAGTPVELKSRVSFQVHDFFTQQDVIGADVYFFRWVMHNWSDKYAIKILRALIPALKSGARIVLNDAVLPEPGTVHPVEERNIRVMDLFILTTVNAKEREVDDWKELFQEADARFEFLKAWKPEKSRMWILEWKWSP